MKWCLKIKNGIKLTEPNGNLSEAYIRKAEESLETMRLVKNRDWKISTAYYTFYFSLYSILMKMGIRSEIHSCTIEFAKRFLADYFTREELKLLEGSLRARIDAQYYVSREVTDGLYGDMIDEAPHFLVKCKDIASKMDERKTYEIRFEIRRLMKKM